MITIMENSNYMPHNVSPAGWLKEYLSRDLNGITGHLDEYCDEAGADIFGDNKVIGGQIKVGPDRFHPTWWNGESEGNWFDGFVRCAELMDEPWANEKAKKRIEHILASDETGYIGIYKPGSRYQTEPNNGELWCQSRILLAMLGYYDATRDQKLLERVKAAADMTIETLGTGNDRTIYFSDVSSGKGHGLTFTEPLFLLYEITKDKKYVDFARLCYDDYSNADVEQPFADCKCGNLLDPEIPFTGHGPHISEHLRIPVLLYHYTGIKKYYDAFLGGMEKLKKCLNTSGVLKSDEDVVNRSRDRLQKPVPLPTVGYEYCAITELTLTMHMAYLATGVTGYADMAERIIFNAAQGAREQDGRAAAYLCSDNLFKAATEMGGSWDFSSAHYTSAVCCIPNSTRFMPYHTNRLWLKTQSDGTKGLCAAFYGPSVLKTEINGKSITIEQKTQYPFEENIEFIFTMNEPNEFPLKLRIPGWAKSTRIMLNGNEIKAEPRGGHITVARKWNNGDRLLLSFTASIELAYAPDKSAAVIRGPLVYALPIEYRKIITHEYRVPGFYDADYFPAENARWDYTFYIDKSPDDIFIFQKNEGTGYPWDNPPVSIKAAVLDHWSYVKEITLLPMGCTILRRTHFPVVSV